MPNKEKQNTTDFRCKKCNKLLARSGGIQNDVEIKCKKCGTFNTFLDSIKEQVIITDPDGKVLFSNDNTSSVTGYSSDEIIGNTPGLWGGQMSKEFYRELWTTIKTNKKTTIVNVVNKKKTGETYGARLRISPVLNVLGEIEFFVGIETVIS